MKKYYTNSDIFNSYIELTEGSGLTKVAQDSSDSKAALEKNPRADSLTKEKISKLYNLEIDSPKEMKYERNIVEVAHPKPKYINNSYDKLNGLVENINERQDILLKIVNKRTNGAIAQHKYAQDEMVRTLVRIANDMDNRNEDGLRTLADDCLDSLKKKYSFDLDSLLDFSDVKEIPSFLRPFVSVVRADLPAAAVGALAATIIGIPALPVVSGIVTTGAALAPIISYLYGTAKRSEFIHKNCKDLLQKIDDVIKDTSGKPKQYLDLLRTKTSELETISIKYYENSQAVISAHEESNLTEEHSSAVHDVNKDLKEIKDKLEEIYPILKQYSSVHNLILTQYREKEDIGDVQGKVIDWLSPMYSGFNPVLELYDAVGSLKESIDDFKIDGKTFKEKVEETIRETKEKLNEKTEEVKSKLEQAGEDKLLESGLDKKDPDDMLIFQRFFGKSPSNDNQEAVQKAARLKIINLIKNS